MTPTPTPPVRPPVPAKSKPAPSAKSLREADAQLPECKRKTPPSADLPETGKKRKKTEKTRRSLWPEAKKQPLPLEHAWAPGDEIRILEAMAEHRRDEQGKLPKSRQLFASLGGRLHSKGFGLKELRRKVRSLKRRHDDDVKGGGPTEEHELRLYRLSKKVWGAIPEPVATSGGGGGDAGAMVGNVHKTIDEMRQLYPYLAHEVVHIVDEPAVLERLLLGIDDSKAHSLNSKINDLREELTEAINESAKMQNIEVSKGWQCPYNKGRSEKSRAANESVVVYLDQLDKMDGARAAAQEELARMGRQLIRLKQNMVASGQLPKAMGCESAESAPQSVVAEKQFSHNVIQRKIAAQEKLARGNNKEVTSKFRPHHNLSRKMALKPKSRPRARQEKIDAESQILHNVDQRKVSGRAQQGRSHHMNAEGEKQVILDSCVRPHRPVAKATLQTCSPSTVVGGKALGLGCCQVFVNEVLDGKAPLIRPFGTMKTMADTLGCSIAWTCAKTRDDTTPGMVPPNQPTPGQG